MGIDCRYDGHNRQCSVTKIILPCGGHNNPLNIIRHTMKFHNYNHNTTHLSVWGREPWTPVISYFFRRENKREFCTIKSYYTFILGTLQVVWEICDNVCMAVKYLAREIEIRYFTYSKHISISFLRIASSLKLGTFLLNELRRLMKFQF